MDQYSPEVKRALEVVISKGLTVDEYRKAVEDTNAAKKENLCQQTKN